MVEDHWVTDETRCRHYMGYSFRLAVPLYAPSQRQNNRCTSRVALIEMSNSSMDPPWGIDPTTPHTRTGAQPRSYMEGGKEGFVIIDDTSAISFVWLYDVRHIFKDNETILRAFKKIK